MAKSFERRGSFSQCFRVGLTVLACSAAAGATTITQTGYMTPTPIPNNPQAVPMFVPAFDSRLGMLNSASITYSMLAIFQATIGSAPSPFPVPVPELVGFQAMVFPGLVKVGGQPIGNSFALQTPTVETFVPSGGVTAMSAASPVQQETLSVFPFLLSSMEVPAAGIPIPIQVATGGVSYTPATPQSIILNDSTLLQAPYVWVTYNYTPLASKNMAVAVSAVDDADASPVPEPAHVLATALILLGLGFARRSVRPRTCG